MGGGDLNLKKSWHPKTMKNQERVWKAEQQQAMEDRKIEEKKKEIQQERMHEDLKRAGQGSGVIKPKKEKLDWMYQGITGNVDREDYLLGRKVDKTLELINAQEGSENKEEESSKPAYVIEHEVAPECVVRRGGDDFQVDMKRKIAEDPLFFIRQQEEKTRSTILSNPMKMQSIQLLVESLKKKKDKKQKSKKKKKDKDVSAKEHKKNKKRKK